ncbi:hypothetical protein [Pseudoxanthomonas dokdonensis]|uniref:Uncharacterized protein n=1 Tax=Pseudoxanthomonas dokdonensis TaxID=344882 RepID=A0A0R0CXJ6_9GAMM|nr:hypothetical protein [Pseudoxanthomonas dokdonensis]KRG70500.1 hypothetical protein ABB29_05315 [Pseudoxanthomonas dokdonensis]
MDTQDLSNGFLILGSIAAVFLFILAILWILVPFAVFGIKPLLRSLIAEQRRNYEMLTAVSQQLHNASTTVVRERALVEDVDDRRIDPRVEPRYVDPPPRY